MLHDASRIYAVGKALLDYRHLHYSINESATIPTIHRLWRQNHFLKLRTYFRKPRTLSLNFIFITDRVRRSADLVFLEWCVSQTGHSRSLIVIGSWQKRVTDIAHTKLRSIYCPKCMWLTFVVTRTYFWPSESFIPKHDIYFWGGRKA